MKNYRRTIAMVVMGIVALLAASLVVAACGAKGQEPFKDAPTGERNSDPADLIEMPDGFSNAATKCDHGNRVYVVFHGDTAYGSIAVVPNDPTCG